MLLSIDKRGDPERGARGDAMSEEHTTELARLAGLFVIARNSGITGQGKPVKPDQVSRTLGACVTSEEAKSMGGPSMTAQDMFELGMVFYRRNTRGDNATARALFGEVLKATDPRDPKAPNQDPQLAAKACAQLAATYRQEWNFEWTADDPTTLSDTERRALLHGKEEVAFALAQESVQIGKLSPSGESPYGHAQLAYLYLYKRQYMKAKGEADEAIRLGRAIAGYSEGEAVKAQVLTYEGDPNGAVTLLLPLVQQPPVPAYYLRQLGQAYWVMTQYNNALQYLPQNSDHRQVLLTLAAVYVESGQVPNAQKLFKDFPDLHRHITIGQYREQAPYQNPAIRNRYITALRTAAS